jgi:hypothetical protein
MVPLPRFAGADENLIWPQREAASVGSLFRLTSLFLINTHRRIFRVRSQSAAPSVAKGPARLRKLPIFLFFDLSYLVLARDAEPVIEQRVSQFDRHLPPFPVHSLTQCCEQASDDFCATAGLETTVVETIVAEAIANHVTAITAPVMAFLHMVFLPKNAFLPPSRMLLPPAAARGVYQPWRAGRSAASGVNPHPSGRVRVGCFLPETGRTAASSPSVNHLACRPRKYTGNLRPLAGATDAGLPAGRLGEAAVVGGLLLFSA